MNPFISVIVPAFNSEKTIVACVDSILAQSLQEFELILINDGSTDSTAQICDSYAQNDCRIKVIHKHNSGVSSSRNMGLDIATGDYIVFIDSDDTVEPYHLEQLYQKGMYDFVTGGYNTQGPDGTWCDMLFDEELVMRPHVQAHPSMYMGKYYFGVTCAKAYKKSIIDNHSLRFCMDIHNGEDSIFIFKFLSFVTDIKIITKCGYNYYYYPTSLARRNHPKNFYWRVLVEKQVNAFFQPYDTAERAWLNNRCFSVLMNLVEAHYRTMDHREAYLLYTDGLFQECISEKKTNGTFTEKLFVFAMNSHKYWLFCTFRHIQSVFKKVFNKIKRTKNRRNGGDIQ